MNENVAIPGGVIIDRILGTEEGSRSIIDDRFLERMNAIRDLQKKQRRTARSSHWLRSESACENAVLVRLAAQLETQADEARRCARDHAAEIVGRLAEEKGILSSTSILFFVTERRTLKVAVLYNACRGEDWEMGVDEQGIVPYVARTGNPYLLPDTALDQDGLYIEENATTRCELAIPIKKDGEVLGVLNLEADSPGAFSQETLERVRWRIDALVPHLLVLRALEPTSQHRCPWHPFVHGWDLQKLFQRLCDAFAEVLGREAAKCTIWYADQPKQDLFAYATYGYDWEFRDQKTLSISGSNLGRMMGQCSSEVITYIPSEEEWFVEREKAQSLKIETGLMTTIMSEEYGDKYVVGCVNVYLDKVEEPEMYGDRESLVREALPEFARILQEIVSAYMHQRVQVALSVLSLEIGKRPTCTLKALMERWIFKVCEVLQTPAGSLYGVDAEGKELLCLASTGFRRVVEGMPQGIDERDDTVEDRRISLKVARGHTLSAFRQGGRPVRRNRIGFPGEQGIPPDCPEAGGQSDPEFICGERFEVGEQSKRRFLGCAVMKGEVPIGVLRVVRQQLSIPFTRCDERMIEAICKEFAGLVEDRRRERLSSSGRAMAR
jgi:GAF domain-containing protein